MPHKSEEEITDGVKSKALMITHMDGKDTDIQVRMSYRCEWILLSRYDCLASVIEQQLIYNKKYLKLVTRESESSELTSSAACSLLKSTSFWV